MRLYLNGERVTAFSESGDVGQNFESYFFNTAVQQFVGAYSYSQSDQTWDGYLAEVYFVDGSSLDGSSFGETNEDTNQWQPKNPTDIKPTLTFGTNGFYLPFSNDALATTFTDLSEQTYTVPAGKTSLEVLVVAGGGAGGNGYAGGGGAGGIVHHTNFAVTPGDILPVIVGAGGAGINTSGPANKGGDSVFSTLTATGGGGGGTSVAASSSGGSGGGGGMIDGTDGTGAAAGQPAVSGATVYANAGGNGEGAPDYTAGGGGGAAAAGSNSSGNAAGPGGAGQLFSNFTSYGESGYFGGGGGGSYNSAYATTAGTGGIGGGGNGRELSAGNGYNASAHTGSGGGGGGRYWAPTSYSGSGGSGTVIVYDGTTYTQFVSGSPHTITANGDAKNIRVSNHSVGANADAHIIGPKIGTGCGAFDGTGDYLSVADSADWTFGTGDFTLESWINITNTEQTLFSQYADASNRWYLTIDNRDAQQSIAFYHHGASCSIETSTGAWPGVHQWTHLAFVRASGVIKVYVDGVSQTLGTNTNPNADLTDIAAALRIGDYNGGNQFNGYLDEIRISNSARYTANFTPDTTAFSSDANTKLLLHCDGAMASTTFTDSSSGTHAVTATGDANIVAPKIGTGMAAFDGTGDYASVADSPEWDFLPSSGYTAEAWISMGTHAGTDWIIGQNVDGNNYWMLGHEHGAGLRFESYSGGSLVLNITGGEIADSNWHHIALVRDGNDVEIFKDGTSVATGTTSSTATFAGDFRVGQGSAHGAFDGYVDEVRISRTARYTSSFTPSTTAFKDDKDTVLLMHMDGGGGIDATTNLPTLVGQGTYFFDDSVNAIFYGADGVPTNKSIISFDGTGDYLSIPTSTDFNPGTNFTAECWFQYGGDDEGGIMGTQNSSGYNGWFFRIVNTTDKLDWNNYGASGGAEVQVITAGSLGWSIGRWYHLAMVKEGNDYELFRDGTSVATLTSSTSLTAGTSLFIGKDYASDETVCKMDQIRISDSARYTSNFTAPTTPFTTDANTKLLIQSDFSEGGLGADHSGNYNYFTPTNLTAADMMEDSPKNNFCTLNPLHWGIRNAANSVPLSEGNLKFVGSDTVSTYGTWYATFEVPDSSGWYFEMVPTAIGSAEKQSQYINVGGKAFKANGESSSGAYGTAWTAGDIIGVAVNSSGVWYSLNGTWQNSGNPVTGSNSAGTPSLPGKILTGDGSATTNSSLSGVLNFGQDSSFAGNKTAQGNQDGNNKGDFYYTPPAGFLALCTDNLPDPSIALPGEYFNTKLYTGTAAELAVTGVGFQPDLTWIKTRTLAYNHRLFDVVRGVTKEVYTNANDAEVTDAQSLKSFDSDGFTLGTGSGSNPSSTMSSWNWKAGTSFDPATAGTVASGSGSASATAGFSIVKYPGSASDVTVGHGLSQAPELILIKNLDAAVSWPVYVGPLGNAKRLELNDPYFEQATTHWVNTSPTASVFTLDGGVQGINNAGEDFIAYCWHSVEGYSKVGSYVGNGVSQDGPFVYLGFKPAFLLVKNTTATAWWGIWDNKHDPDNTVTYENYPNSNVAEGNNTGSTNGPGTFDFTSNGFKGRRKAAESMTNTSGNTYFYLAIAESPFKTSNAR